MQGEQKKGASVWKISRRNVIMIIALRVVQSNALWEAGHAISLISNDMSALAVLVIVSSTTD